MPNEGEAMNQIDVTGRVAVVTGGARGIGYAIAHRLTESGARVAIWDRDGAAARSAAETLAGSIALAVDVTDAAAIDAAADATEARLGPIGILVNNAGIGGVNAPVTSYPIDGWRAVIEINLTAVFLCCRSVVGRMQQRDYGRVVNIASIAGKEGNPNAAAYSASKAGVIALTKSLGKELATTGIRVNCVTPGVVRTDMVAAAAPEFVDYMLSKIPMGRFGKVEEVAGLVAWLSSDECSFSTGAVFDISGGRATY
jgi:NAD(P)-dependent dehydrogenase (short-subunit alcohol dehydrogenase family)